MKTMDLNTFIEYQMKYGFPHIELIKGNGAVLLWTPDKENYGDSFSLVAIDRNGDVILKEMDEDSPVPKYLNLDDYKLLKTKMGMEKVISVRMDTGLMASLEAISASEQVTLSQLMREALEEFSEEKKDKK